MRSRRVAAPFHFVYLAAGVALVAFASVAAPAVASPLPWVLGGIGLGAVAGVLGLPLTIEGGRGGGTYPALAVLSGFMLIVWLRREAGLVLTLGFVLAAMPLMDMMRRWWRLTRDREGRVDV